MLGLFFAIVIAVEAVEQCLEVAIVGSLERSSFFVAPVSPFFHGSNSRLSIGPVAKCSEVPGGVHVTRATFRRLDNWDSGAILENHGSVVESE